MRGAVPKNGSCVVGVQTTNPEREVGTLKRKAHSAGHFHEQKGGGGKKPPQLKRSLPPRTEKKEKPLQDRSRL